MWPFRRVKHFRWSNDREFWQIAARNAPWRFRFFRQSIIVERLDAQYPQFDQWIELKESLQAGDLIWPFAFNHRTYLAYREGFVVMRNGSPIGGIVTICS